jgi:hypothetical protein
MCVDDHPFMLSGAAFLREAHRIALRACMSGPITGQGHDC